MKNEELGHLREAIDAVDTELLRLFERRMGLCRQVGEYKARRGLPVLDPAREAQVLEKRAGQASSPELSSGARDFFAELMRISRALQQPLVEAGALPAPRTIAYQGIAGAYGHQALLQHFGEEAQTLPCPRFEDVFRAVQEGRAELGIVPLENSSSGSIAEVYDLLGRYGLWIVGEELVRVRHALLGLPGATIEDIRTVYSHEQGFLQCPDFLESHPDWQRIPCFNTAVAARRVREEDNPQSAAIASPLAGEAYGLAVLEGEIQSFAGNTTRFIVIGRERRAGGTKATLSLTLRHERGALHRALACFVALGANLTRIESRPIPGTPFEYRFFVDVEGALSGQRLDVLLEVLREDCESCSLLGVYGPAEANDG